MSELLPDTLRKIIENLKFISKIGENVKPCFNNQVFVQADSLWGALYRMRYNETHYDMTQKIRTAVEDGIAQHALSVVVHHKLAIVKSLQEAKPGIGRLLTTYKSYPGVVGSLETTLLELNEFLRQFEPPTPSPRTTPTALEDADLD